MGDVIRKGTLEAVIESIWSKTSNGKKRSALDQHIHADVAVNGGGQSSMRQNGRTGQKISTSGR